MIIPILLQARFWRIPTGPKPILKRALRNTAHVSNRPNSSLPSRGRGLTKIAVFVGFTWFYHIRSRPTKVTPLVGNHPF